MPAYRLLEVLLDTAGHVRNLDAPMVGRGKELEILRQALRRVIDERTSHLFTLLGPAGVGKSRLVREFLADRAMRASCADGASRTAKGITYYALAEIVRDAAGLADGVDAATSRIAIESMLDDMDEAEAIADSLGGVLGWAEPGGPEDTAWAVRKLFEHLARTQPLVLVIDDLHWAEPLLLDLVEHLADWSRDAPVLLLVIARPELLELRAGWGGGKVNATTILLEPLPGDATTELLDNLLGDNDLPLAARDRILAAADGNPLFVEEMVGMLIDDGLLRFDGQMWRAAEDLADLTVPPTIQLLLAARLDRLDAEERAVMERGAVEGKVFHAGAVTSLVPEGLRAQVRPRLLTLARKELIRPDRAEFAGEDAFRFRHLLIRDAAYQAMPKEQRADLHERFAEWLDQVSGTRHEDYVEILAHHLEQAWRYRRELGLEDDRTRALGNRAAAELRTSAVRSVDRGDLPTANHLLERGVEMATGRDRDETLVDLAEVVQERSQFREARSVAETLVDADDPVVAIRAEVVRFVATMWTDPTFRHEEALARLETLRERAREIGTQEIADRCVLFMGLIRFFAGSTEAFREVAVELLPRVDSMTFSERRTVAFGISSSLVWGPLPVEAAAEVPDQVERIYGGSLVGRARGQALRLVLHSMADDGPGYDEAAERLDALHGEIGDETFEYLNAGPRLESLWRMRRVEEAVERGLAAKVVFDGLQETGANSTLTPITAYYAVELGRHDLAEELLADALTMASPDDFAAHVPILWVSSLLAAHGGDHAAAADDIGRALEWIGTTDYVTFHGETERVHAKVLLAAGHTDDAVAAFDTAIAICERKGDVASARHLMDERNGGA